MGTDRVQKGTGYALILIIVVGIILLAAVFVLRPQWIIGSDGFGYYAYLRSAIFDHDLNFQNEYQMFDNQFGAQTLTYWRTPLDKAGNPFAIGASLLWAPFVGIAYLAQQLFEFADPYPLPGYNLPFQVALGIGTWFYVFLGLILLFKALAKIFISRLAFLAVLALFLISGLPYYLIYEPILSHGLSFFVICLLFYGSIRLLKKERPVWFCAVIVGLIIGFCFLIRWQNIIFAIIPLVIMAHRVKGKEKYPHFLLVLIGFSLVSFWQLLVWKILYGSWIFVPQGAGFFDLTSPHLWQFFFSGYHGMFIINPLLLLGIIGLFIALRKHTLLTVLLLITLALQIYLNAGLADWFAGGSFGARRMVGSYFIIAFGLASLFSLVKNKKIIVYFLAILILGGTVFNFLLMASYARGIIKINEPTTIIEVYSAPKNLFH